MGYHDFYNKTLEWLLLRARVCPVLRSLGYCGLACLLMLGGRVLATEPPLSWLYMLGHWVHDPDLGEEGFRPVCQASLLSPTKLLTNNICRLKLLKLAQGQSPAQAIPFPDFLGSQHLADVHARAISIDLANDITDDYQWFSLLTLSTPVTLSRYPSVKYRIRSGDHYQVASLVAPGSVVTERRLRKQQQRLFTVQPEAQQCPDHLLDRALAYRMFCVVAGQHAVFHSDLGGPLFRIDDTGGVTLYGLTYRVAPTAMKGEPLPYMSFHAQDGFLCQHLLDAPEIQAVCHWLE